jgi:hypothetical protein
MISCGSAKSTPADVTNQHPLFILGGGLIVRFEFFQQRDGDEIVAALLFQRAEANPVLVGDAEVVLVARRFWF